MPSLSSSLLAVLLASGVQAGVLRREAIQPKYRISPIDGSKIAIPTKQQLDFQAKEIGMLIHFNIATYISSDGCNNDPSLVPNITLFDPEKLNTDQWVQTMNNLGAKYATLVAKHNCGFATWPSKVKFETTDYKTQGYNYTIAGSPVHGKDVVRSFTASTSGHGIGHGFYYSVNVNNFLGVSSNQVAGGSAFAPGTVNPNLAPGQVSINQTTYNEIVYDQLTELWSNYGPLTEIWFDGGYSSDQKDKLQSLLQAHQPNSVIFNGCTTDGDCVSPHSIRWIGTEAGNAPDENWSTGTTNDGGDPNSPIFCPAECDTTLQTQDRWFWGVDQPIRSLQEMKDVYHQSVGHNCVLELDLSPDRTGLIPAAHVARYKELGDFVKKCYSQPSCDNAVHYRSKPGVYLQTFPRPATLDRVMLMEDQTNGQVIRTYNVYAKTVQKPQEWTLLSQGTSIGNKKIDLLGKRFTIHQLMVNTTYVDTPKWKEVTVHLCDNL